MNELRFFSVVNNENTKNQFRRKKDYWKITEIIDIVIVTSETKIEENQNFDFETD